MGFMDIFKKKDKDISKPKNIQNTMDENAPELSMLSDGRLNVKYYNEENKEFYDTTRLTIDFDSPFIIGGKQLYNCVVAWDGKHDCRRLDEKENENNKIAGNRSDYKGVWLDLDMFKLQTDSEYTKVLMNELLLRSRVYKMIEEGLKENPERPCGKYVGGVINQEGIYKKSFDTFVGRAAHNDPFMVNRRAKLREKDLERRNAQIEANKAKIAELQNENASLLERE